MTFRTRFMIVTAGWAVLVTGLLILVPWALRDRLPDVVASHWGFSGVPDGSMSLVGITGFTLALWGFLAVGGFVVARTGGLRQRRVRAPLAAALGAAGVFVLGLTAVTVWANLDVVDWRQARSVSWQVMPVLGAALLAGLLGLVAGRWGPNDIPDEDGSAPVLDLEPGKRAVWVSSSTNRVLTCLSIALVVAPVLFVAYRWPGAEFHTWTGVIVFAFVGLVCLALSSVRVHVGESGVAIAFGPLRWPVRRIRLGRVESARSEDRMAITVGGWGYRGLPGRATIMIRSGECLVLRYASGGELGISVDDAERGAALLNTLLANQRA